MTRIRLMGLIFWVIGVVAAGGAAAASDRSVIVSGAAQRTVMPDIVVWTVTVNAEDPKLRAAKADNDERISAALAAAKDLAESNGHVELGPVAINRIYTEWKPGVQRVFTHFKVTRSFKLTQRDVSQFEKTMNALINSAEVELGYKYEISNEESIRGELRLQALDTAEAKARAMVEHMGAKLGPVEKISEFAPGERGPSGARYEVAPEAILGDRGLASPEARKLSLVVYATFAIE